MSSEVWLGIRIAIWVIGIPTIVFLVRAIVNRIRAIERLDAEMRAEEEQATKNPYAEMARLYEAQKLLDEARGKKR